MIPLLIATGCADGLLASTRPDTADGRLQERLSHASAVVATTHELRDEIIAISRAHDPTSAVTASERARLSEIGSALERNRASVEDGGTGGLLNDRCITTAVEASSAPQSVVTAVLKAENAALRYVGSVCAKAGWFGAGPPTGEGSLLGIPQITEKLVAVEPYEFELAAAEASTSLSSSREYAAFAPFLVPCPSDSPK